MALKAKAVTQFLPQPDRQSWQQSKAQRGAKLRDSKVLPLTALESIRKARTLIYASENFCTQFEIKKISYDQCHIFLILSYLRERVPMQ